MNKNNLVYIINKLFEEFFDFKYQNLREKKLDNSEVINLIKYIYSIFMKKKKYINEDERKQSLQVFYALIELEYLKEKHYTNLKAWIGDYPWLFKRNNENKLNDITQGFLEKKLYNDNFKIGNKVFYEKQNELIDIFKKESGNFLVSAPTSFGKTQIMLDNLKSNSCIIIPTIALQNEVANKLRKNFGFKVISKSNTKYEKNCIYVFTQEKLFNFISLNKSANIKFDCFIIDEAHHLLSNDPRSFILEHLIKQFYNNQMFKKIIFLSPKSEKIFFKEKLPLNLYEELEFIKLDNFFITDRILFLNEKKTIIYWNYISERFEKIKDDYNFNLNKTINNLKEKPIIFTSKNKMKSLAKDLEIYFSTNINDETKKLLDYIKENIGENYEEFTFFKNGILIHNGDSDKTVRLMTENIFSNTNNKILVANQTIMSGVNLKCSNLIIESRIKYWKKIDFLNLIGRVGRYSPENSSYLGSVVCMSNISKIKEEIFENKKMTLSDYETNSDEEIKKINLNNTKTNYEDLVLKSMWENKQKNENLIPIYLKNNNESLYKERILENKDFFMEYFKNKKTREATNKFIDKLIELFDWDDEFNPFNIWSKTWCDILKIYYFNYISGMTIKEMVQHFIIYAKQKNKVYYVNKSGNLTLNHDHKEAEIKDIINSCIRTINGWIDHKLSTFIYYVVFILNENSENIYIDIEKDVDNIETELEKELLSYGIERHLVKKIKEKYKKCNSIDDLKNELEKENNYFTHIFRNLGIL